MLITEPKTFEWKLQSFCLHPHFFLCLSLTVSLCLSVSPSCVFICLSVCLSPSPSVLPSLSSSPLSLSLTTTMEHCKLWKERPLIAETAGAVWVWVQCSVPLFCCFCSDLPHLSVSSIVVLTVHSSLYLLKILVQYLRLLTDCPGTTLPKGG